MRQLLQQGGQLAVQFPLAGVAALGGVAAVGRVAQFGGADLALLDPHPSRLLAGLLTQVRCQGRRHTGHGERPFAQLLGGDRRHQGTVHAA